MLSCSPQLRGKAQLPVKSKLHRCKWVTALAPAPAHSCGPHPVSASACRRLLTCCCLSSGLESCSPCFALQKSPRYIQCPRRVDGSPASQRPSAKEPAISSSGGSPGVPVGGEAELVRFLLQPEVWALTAAVRVGSRRRFCSHLPCPAAAPLSVRWGEDAQSPWMLHIYLMSTQGASRWRTKGVI